MSQSIADQFIEVMAAIRAIDIASNDPMRHVMRNLKQEAEQTLSDAIRRAGVLAYHARDVRRDAAEAIKEAVEAATQTESKEPN